LCALSPSQLACLSVHPAPLSAWTLTPHGCDTGWEHVFLVERGSSVSSHRPSRGPSHTGTCLHAPARIVCTAPGQEILHVQDLRVHFLLTTTSSGPGVCSSM
ncbi:hypothetical protein B0H14DRAFT_2718967, partial [Mycena olivaceomarginata]